MNYGPAPDEGGVEIAMTFDQYAAEYAAIRRRVGILHLPQKAILRCTGKDRKDFLHRMLTQDINGMTGGQSRRAMQLNNKGRIIADLVVHHGDLDTWLELDRFDLPALRELLEGRLFSEDVAFEDLTDQRTVFAIHGPASIALLNAASDAKIQTPIDKLGTHHVISIANTPITASRCDGCGVLGYHLFVPTDKAETVYQKLLDAAGFDAALERELGADYAQQRRQGLRGRPVGWLAYNTARIEAGSPIFHVDFSSDSLPAETGILDEAVSFTKGCYLGQEIVARMHNLGHPRRVLVGIKCPGDELPIAGAQLLDCPDGNADRPGDVVGGITSSTNSPLLGGKAIAFGIVKWKHHKLGTQLVVNGDGKLIVVEVCPLNFLATGS